MSAIHRLRGQIRLLRGRCPGCASEGASVRSCGVCHGYLGPFPPGEDSVQRWAARFDEQAALAYSARAAEPAALSSWTPVR